MRKNLFLEEQFGYVDPHKGMTHEQIRKANKELLDGPRCKQCGLPLAWCNERAELREATIKLLRMKKGIAALSRL